jgi:hypothetical protein
LASCFVSEAPKSCGPRGHTNATVIHNPFPSLIHKDAGFAVFSPHIRSISRE